MPILWALNGTLDRYTYIDFCGKITRCDWPNMKQTQS